MSVFRKKWEFLFLCCLTYMCAYLCRVNLSSALGKMELALDASTAQLGLLGTAYFFSYACAQLVCGFFGDRVRPERLVLLGVTGIASMNIGISFCAGYGQILPLWCLNGVFQSMLWGPMSRLLAGRFLPEERVRVSTCYSMSMPVGYILGWSALAPLLGGAAWTYNFLVPGLIVALPAAMWAMIAASAARDPAFAPVSRQKPSLRAVIATVREDKLWRIAIACLCNGIVKESFTVWAPTLLTRLLGVGAGESALYLVMFPVCNALFIAAIGAVANRARVPLRRLMAALFCAIAVCACALIFLPCGAIVTVALMAAISGFGYAANSLCMGVLPMSYAEKNVTSSLVGVFDFSAYIGAGIAAYGLGVLISGSDVRPIAAVWLAAALIAALQGALPAKRARGEAAREDRAS